MTGESRVRGDSAVLLCLPLLVLALCGCSLFKLRRDNAKLDQFVEVHGEVEVDDWSGAPLVVSLLRAPDRLGSPAVVEGRFALEEPGKFVFRVPPGRYQLGAYEDRNHNFSFEARLGERGGLYRHFEPFELLPGRERYTHADVVIRDDLPEVLNQLESITYTQSNMFLEGKVVPLDDPRFAPANASLGVWQPLTFAEHLGMGVFMLGDYAPDRVPVLFVHGMGGHPREFEPLIGCLDKQRYQVWVVQYASGWRLEPLAIGLHRVLADLHLRYGFSEMHIVAHSMGGLLSRRVMREHAERHQQPFITKLITLASPLGGMPAADKGVAHSPVVVPSWRDIGPRSAFVQELYARPLPQATQYTLFFGFDRDNSDGVVQLSSQLRREAQREATRVLGFETTHTKILADKTVCAELNRAVEAAGVGPQSAPPAQAAAP